MNFTESGSQTLITYTGCASSSIYKPWCPTRKLPKPDIFVPLIFSQPFSVFFSEIVGNNIVEWGYCLDDCPHEEPEVVCNSDPPFTPTLVDDMDGFANFTTLYDFGMGTLNKEVKRKYN